MDGQPLSWGTEWAWQVVALGPPTFPWWMLGLRKHLDLPSQGSEGLSLLLAQLHDADTDLSSEERHLAVSFSSQGGAAPSPSPTHNNRMTAKCLTPVRDLRVWTAFKLAQNVKEPPLPGSKRNRTLIQQSANLA